MNNCVFDNLKKSSFSQNSFHYACAHGHPDAVTLLIAWKCDIDLCDSDNSMALIRGESSQQFHYDMDLL